MCHLSGPVKLPSVPGPMLDPCEENMLQTGHMHIQSQTHLADSTSSSPGCCKKAEVVSPVNAISGNCNKQGGSRLAAEDRAEWHMNIGENGA